MAKDITKEVKKAESRREFLKTAGKFAIYTPPALMIMSNSHANMTYSCNPNIASRECRKEEVQ